MLKTASSVVLGSSKSSTYPRGYASGFDSPAALLEGRFEHPARLIFEDGLYIFSRMPSRDVLQRVRLSFHIPCGLVG
jgi:hypothetical protein